MSEVIDKDLLQRAYLETVYWWVDCEYQYHDLFKEAPKVSNKENFQNVFYSFTQKYSVRRTVKGDGQEATDSLLADLIECSFIKDALKGTLSLIDVTDKALSGKSIRSLLSKFATLINPRFYTMYDTRGVDSLKSFGGVSSYSSYAGYHEVFKDYQQIFDSSIKKSDLGYYLDLCHTQGKPCPEDVFRNRLADKYLWVKQD